MTSSVGMRLRTVAVIMFCTIEKHKMHRYAQTAENKDECAGIFSDKPTDECGNCGAKAN
jgi:hypothetical protein